MVTFVPNDNVKDDKSFGQPINKALKKYITPELNRRGRSNFSVAGIEILKAGESKIYLDSEVTLSIEFKESKIKPNDVGKPLKINLREVKDIKWHKKKTNKADAQILVMHFNENWWVWSADFGLLKNLEQDFKFTREFDLRGGGYLPLKMRRQEKADFFKAWEDGLKDGLPAMWRRHITVSQRYRGAIVYDGNYFDLFSHAQELYIMGYYYSSITICRAAAEQALVKIILKSGKGFDIYKKVSGKQRLKSIEQLVETCRSYSLFKKKYPINKKSAKNLNDISRIASDLSHLKHNLEELEAYKSQALICMDKLYYVIKNHLNFIKDTGVISGYKIKEPSRRLQ